MRFLLDTHAFLWFIYSAVITKPAMLFLDRPYGAKEARKRTVASTVCCHWLSGEIVAGLSPG